MADSTIWWVLTGGAVLVELVTGTFYLLMVALGLAAGAVAAHLGLAMPAQLITSAVVGAGAVVGCYQFKKRRGAAELPASSNRDVNLDVGETVQVDAWNPDGTASVKYRGAQWTVMHRPGNAPTAGAHRVAEVIGNRLLVDKI